MTVAPEEVSNRLFLVNYLESLPVEEAPAIASRVASGSAMRILPVAVSETQRGTLAQGRARLTPLVVFWACSIIAIIASKRVAGPEAARAGVSALEVQGATYAVGLALDAVQAQDIRRQTSNAAASAEGASYAATRAGLDLWPLIRRDLVEETAQVWPEGTPQAMAEIWAEAVAAMRADKADWSFWIAWYERVVAGRDWHPAQMLPILNGIFAEDWEKGPGHINPKFDKVLALYRAEDFVATNPYGFRASIDDTQKHLELHPVEVVDLSEIVERLREAFCDFNRRAERAAEGNQLAIMCKDALDPEISDLRSIIRKHAQDAQALHYQLKRYEKHMRRVLHDRDLPVTAETASLLDDLRDAQDGICLISEPVREAEKRRHALALDRASRDQLLTAIRNCAGMATDGQGEMRVFASLAMRALANPDASPAEKQMAWMFAYRMGAESAVLIKTHEAEGKVEKGSFGKRMKDAVDYMSIADKGIDLVQEATTEVAGSGWFQQLIEYLSQNPNIPGAS